MPAIDYQERSAATRHAENQGVGAAIKRGYAQALEDGIDVVAVMDGDGQMDPDHLHRIIEPVVEGRAAYSKGNRLHRQVDHAGMSRWRLFGNGLLTLLTRAASGYWEMSDPQNGYTAISREALETIPFQTLYDRYGFTNEVLVQLNTYDFTIANVTHPAVYGDEESHIDYTSFVPVLSWLLFQRFCWRLKTRYVVKEFHPIVTYYPLGIGSMIAGVAGGMYMQTTSGGGFVGAMAALAVVLLGFLMFSLAILFDVERNSGSVVSVTNTNPTSTAEVEDVTWIESDDKTVIGSVNTGSRTMSNESLPNESDGGVTE
ncbi:MAG: glycosyltransferase family 2 protein [Desulfosudaceae bacterium]